MDHLTTEVLSNGTTSSGAIFSRIDDETFWLDYVKYKIVDSHLEIVGYDKIELPANPKLYAEVKINGVVLKTRKIASFAFESSRCSKVTIPYSVIVLENCCFHQCESLSSISLPDKMTSIGIECFAFCSSLEYIELPSELDCLGCECFWRCSSLTTIRLPESLTSLSPGCFSDCTALSSINLPSELRDIGDYCFYNCESLTAVEFSSKKTEIGRYCFKDCISLISVCLPSEITYVDGSWFSGCTSLETLVMPSMPNRFGYYLGLALSLKEIYFRSDIPTEFYGSGYTEFRNVIVYVPRRSYNNYISSKYYSYFKEVKPIDY